MEKVLFDQKKVSEINSILWQREQRLSSISSKMQEISFLPKHTKGISRGVSAACVHIQKHRSLTGSVQFISIQFNSIYSCSSDPEGGCNPQDIERVNSI